MASRLPIVRALFPLLLLLLPLLVACQTSQRNDECSPGDGGCDGNVARVCEYERDPCDHEGCWDGATSGYEWRRTSCGSRTCVGKGLCALEAAADPRCAGVRSYCDGIVAVGCEDGFAMARDDGFLRLLAEDVEESLPGASAFVLRVGARSPFSLVRRSVCGELDVSATARVTSDAPGVLAIEDDAVHAVGVGHAAVVTDEGEVVAEFDVLRDCSAPSVDAPHAINLTPERAELNVGEVQSLAANAFWEDRCSERIDGRPDVTWTSDDETVATVTPTGKVTAVGVGVALVVLTWRGVSSSGAWIRGVP